MDLLASHDALLLPASTRPMGEHRWVSMETGRGGSDQGSVLGVAAASGGERAGKGICEALAIRTAQCSGEEEASKRALEEGE